MICTEETQLLFLKQPQGGAVIPTTLALDCHITRSSFVKTFMEKSTEPQE